MDDINTLLGLAGTIFAVVSTRSSAPIMAANFFVLLVTAALFSASYGAAVQSVQARDYVNCQPQVGDRLLYQGAVYKAAKYLQRVSQDLAVSAAGAAIHCITAYNSKTTTPAADVSVASGGLGFNYVTLHFQSQRSHGIHYNVTVSGR